jgi:hypothetical protein
MSATIQWFTSSYSSNEGGNCVEVASHTSAVHVRDSKTPDGPILTVAADTWSDFLTQLGSLA